MTLTWNTKDWGWLPCYWRQATLTLENNKTKDGWVLNSIDDVVYYLADVEMADCYTAFGFMQEAVFNCATELGCAYEDVYELAEDIRKYYI